MEYPPNEPNSQNSEFELQKGSKNHGTGSASFPQDIRPAKRARVENSDPDYPLIPNLSALKNRMIPYAIAWGSLFIEMCEQSDIPWLCDVINIVNDLLQTKKAS